jgi:hypothetical protein
VKYYSNFYGGLIVGASQYMRATIKMEGEKKKLGISDEIKWEKVDQVKLAKYQRLIESFFEEVRAANIKIRIMFRQNAQQPRGLSREQIQIGYFLLYYQMLKHAFGLEHIESSAEKTKLRLYFDKFPDTKEKSEQFKGYLLALPNNKKFGAANFIINKEDITEVSSHDHILLQCLDVVLGAIAFRLNDKHKAILPGSNRRGKRTKAKEVLYKSILAEIRKIHPHFNIGITTGSREETDKWNSPYRHWNFVPRSAAYEKELTKRGKKK